MILSSLINQPWFIFILVLLIFIVVVIAVWLFRKYVFNKPKKGEEEHTPTEEEIAEQELNSYLVDIETDQKVSEAIKNKNKKESLDETKQSDISEKKDIDNSEDNNASEEEIIDSELNHILTDVEEEQSFISEEQKEENNDSNTSNNDAKQSD